MLSEGKWSGKWNVEKESWKGVFYERICMFLDQIKSVGGSWTALITGHSEIVNVRFHYHMLCVVIFFCLTILVRFVHLLAVNLCQQIKLQPADTFVMSWYIPRHFLTRRQGWSQSPSVQISQTWILILHLNLLFYCHLLVEGYQNKSPQFCSEWSGHSCKRNVFSKTTYNILQHLYVKTI